MRADRQPEKSGSRLRIVFYYGRAYPSFGRGNRVYHGIPETARTWARSREKSPIRGTSPEHAGDLLR